MTVNKYYDMLFEAQITADIMSVIVNLADDHVYTKQDAIDDLLQILAKNNLTDRRLD